MEVREELNKRGFLLSSFTEPVLRFTLLIPSYVVSLVSSHPNSFGEFVFNYST